MVHLTYRFGNTGGSSAAQTDAITIMHIWLRLDYITPRICGKTQKEVACLSILFWQWKLLLFWALFVFKCYFSLWGVSMLA